MNAAPGPERLFAYGTLAPGRENHALVAGLAGTWEPASVRGRVARGTRGSAWGYPALILGEAGGEVPG